MARRSKSAGRDPFADLAKKVEILERELSVQRTAMERLKEMVGTRLPRRTLPHSAETRRTA
jgi:hypothetical protein